MNTLSLCYVTFPTRADAERIVEALLEERLAACANILAPCTSLYLWHRQLERSEEVPVLLKTRPTLAMRLRARLTALHPYDVPVIESWEAEAGSEAAAWVMAETQ